MLTCALHGWKIHMHDPHQGQIMTDSHVWRKGLMDRVCTDAHSGLCAHCSVVPNFAKEFLWLLCGHGIPAELSPGKAAVIMRPLKAGGAASTSLVKTPLNYSCKGHRRSCDNIKQEQNCSQVYFTKILSCRVGPLQVGGSFLTTTVTLQITTNLMYLACTVDSRTRLYSKPVFYPLFIAQVFSFC